MQKMIMRYPRPVSLAQMNFLDTHDVPRFMTYCEDDKKRLILAYFYLFMGVGIPSVFYGDECYISGKEEPEYRSPMRWNCEDSFADLISEYAKIRTEHKAIRLGTYRKIEADDEKNIYVFERKYEDEKLTIVINNSDKEEKIKESLLDAYEPVYGDLVKDGSMYWVPAMSAAVYINR